MTWALVFFRICNAVTKSHPQRSDVHKSDLDKALPSVQDTQAAFVRLKQLCVNGNSRLLHACAGGGRVFALGRRVPRGSLPVVQRVPSESWA